MPKVEVYSLRGDFLPLELKEKIVSTLQPLIASELSAPGSELEEHHVRFRFITGALGDTSTNDFEVEITSKLTKDRAKRADTIKGRVADRLKAVLPAGNDFFVTLFLRESVIGKYTAGEET